MKIVITTGIFEPESGGPAMYAPALARKLVEAGHAVTVITFSDQEYIQSDVQYPFKLIRVVRGNKILNRLRFFNTLMRHARGCDLIYTLDWFAVGLPAAFASARLRIPYVVRVGGDYAWEQKYLESGAKPIPLAQFYERGIYREFPYSMYFRIIRFVLSHARHVVFNSDRERSLYEQFFAPPSNRTSVIYNPRPHIADHKRPEGTPSKEFVYWGRLIEMKNVESLVRAFARANIPDYTLAIIGDGTHKNAIEKLVHGLNIGERVTIAPSMPQSAVFDRIKHARAFILPSWTDISPNQVFEALSLGLPALVTKENYLPIRDQLPAMIDPASVDDIARGLEMLADDQRYADFATRFLAIQFDYDWNAVTQQHEALFNRIVNKNSNGIRVLSIGADRSKRGILYPDSPAAARQKAYGENFGALDIIGFSRTGDGRRSFELSPKVHIYPTNSFSPLFYGLDTLRIMRRLPRPDVITAQDPFETGLLALLIARLYRLPLHVQVHTDFTSPEYRAHSLLNRIRALIAGYVLRRATRIRVVSHHVQRVIRVRYTVAAPITVLPIFTDVERFKNSHTHQELVNRFAQFSYKFLVVARLEPEKNVALAIQSFAQASIPESCLIIVGQGSERGLLEDLARTHHVSDHVFFEGEQPAIDYYPIADLVLVTSHYEGYGLVIVEALASGKPVLSRDVGIALEMGAIVAGTEDFPQALARWVENGPREMHLGTYPYADYGAYVRAYCDDIIACKREA